MIIVIAVGQRAIAPAFAAALFIIGFVAPGVCELLSSAPRAAR